MSILNRLDMGLKLYLTKNLELTYANVGGVTYGSLAEAQNNNKPEGVFLQAYSA